LGREEERWTFLVGVEERGVAMVTVI